jgi:hypothetical protein
MKVLAVLLLAACASAPPPPPPKLTEIPGGVLDAFCARLHDEGVSVETTVDVVSITQPLITPQSMEGLAEAAFYKTPFDPVAMSEAANRESAPLPVLVPRGTCSWRAVEETAHRANDVMTIELSSPFRNPFVRNAFGLLARVSLANESATWYWVPLGERNGHLVAGTPVLMGMR